MGRKVYCDYLRIIAIFSVIVLHVAALDWHTSDVNGAEWKALCIYDSIVRWGVPVFVMISGALFLGRDIPIKRIYSKYILRMVVAFVFWGFFYAIVTKDTIQYGILYGIKTHVGSIVSGYYHMWFILMIIGLYMCIPIIKKIISDEKIMKYFLLLSFTFACLIPWIFQLINDFSGNNNETIQWWVNEINSDISTMGMNIVLGYSFFFVLGYYLDRIEMEKKSRVVVLFLE